MTRLTHFSSPAYLTDFTPENEKVWSAQYVSPHITMAAKSDQVSQFYNELESNHTQVPKHTDITWTAFPNTVRDEAGGDLARWEAAEDRDKQDEYCEWSVKRNEEDEIVRVVFTAEGPEYWKWLARLQPQTVLDLYREHNPGFDIKKEHLFDKNGVYIKKNKWNDSAKTGSIMHLVQDNNSLWAQFYLAAQSTVLRIDSKDNPITDADRLVRCSMLGGTTRNSDPHIGISINNLARGTKPLITVANPIGLYLHSFNATGLTAPDGADVSTFWKWTRGTPADPANGRPEAHWVRGVFEVPEGKDYVVSDIVDQNERRIEWGSQLADRIQVRVTGQFIQEGIHTAESFKCLMPVEALAESGALRAIPASGDVDEEDASSRAHGLTDPGWACY